MANIVVEKTLPVSPDALWELVKDFGNVRWIPGASETAQGEGDGPGMARILGNPEGGSIREILDSIDEEGRAITYSIPEGVPFPVSRYCSTMTVSDDGGDARLSWSCDFEPDGASEAEAGGAIEGMYGVMAGWIQDCLKE